MAFLYQKHIENLRITTHISPTSTQKGRPKATIGVRRTTGPPGEGGGGGWCSHRELDAKQTEGYEVSTIPQRKKVAQKRPLR